MSALGVSVVLVVLRIDSSEAFLRPSQLTALIEAVRSAAGHNEHRWIEWKSALDLASAAGQGHIAKAILGFANRAPAAASRNAQGYGYLLVGVEPGGITGVTPIDPEILVGQLRAAVGDKVRWTPEYVTVAGVDVLVIIVDPPRPGDPIHYLRKQLDRFQTGTIFVRHTGRTDPATPADLDMLQARLLDRVPGLQLNVLPTSSMIETAADVTAAAQQWVEQQEPILTRARHRKARGWGVDAELFGVSALSIGRQVIPDERTEEQYAEEISDYLERAKAAFIDRAVWAMYRHEGSKARLRVENPTDLGLSAVRLRVHLAGDVLSYSEALLHVAQTERAAFPRKPKPLGTPTIKDSIRDMLANLGNYRPYIPNLYLPPAGSQGATGPGYTVTDGGSIDIEYDEFDLRPGDNLPLPAVPVLIRVRDGASLVVTWDATAHGSRGRLQGEFELAVVSSTLDLTSIDTDPSEDHD